MLKHSVLYSTTKLASWSDLGCLMGSVMSVMRDLSGVGNIFDRSVKDMLLFIL